MPAGIVLSQDRGTAPAPSFRVGRRNRMAGNPLNVVIFTSVPPRQVARIMARIRRDAPQAQVVGVLYERRPPKTLQQRMGIWRKKMGRLVYWRYVLHRIFAAAEG